MKSKVGKVTKNYEGKWILRHCDKDDFEILERRLQTDQDEHGNPNIYLFLTGLKKS